MNEEIHANERAARGVRKVGGFEVDYKIEFRRLLDRNVGWLRATQNFIDELSGAAEKVREVWSIRH
jgi:hypothetical protein